MLDALEHADGELTGGWLEPISIMLTVKKMKVAMRKGRAYLKQQNDQDQARRSLIQH